jgi:hypothetical protein
MASVYYLFRLLTHDDVNLFAAHKRDHGAPLGDPIGDIVPCHSHGVIKVDVNSFSLRIGTFNPACHWSFHNFECDV